MSGIAGVGARGRRALVERMLEKIAHRGRGGCEIVEVEGATLGAVWPAGVCCPISQTEGVVRDSAGDGHFAEARAKGGRIALSRDSVGAAPLYYGCTQTGELCFASEVKGLLEATRDVREVEPGAYHDGRRWTPAPPRSRLPHLAETPEEIARGLRARLEAAVRGRIRGAEAGAWLSGGLDSSAIAALARACVARLHTVAGGVAGAPDLEHARAVAAFLGTVHHEVIVGLDEMLAVLPTVIYHLESFDALLVRSSVMNYLVAQRIAGHATEVFSGEGGDELFAGYDYLKAIGRESLADELLDITGRLHNTALQRVDRSAAAHGLVVHVPFVHPEVLAYAHRIPVAFKIRDGVEKWILRQALEGMLPPAVLHRPKAKFWEGAGVADLLARHADERIPDAEFSRERTLANGWVLNSKEELMYYRIFREWFGRASDLSWMGRTKLAPTAAGTGPAV